MKSPKIGLLAHMLLRIAHVWPLIAHVLAYFVYPMCIARKAFKSKEEPWTRCKLVLCIFAQAWTHIGALDVQGPS